MSAIICVCGKRIVLTGNNLETEMTLVPESWIDEIALELGKIKEEDYFDSFLNIQKTVYKCPNCYRYWFENEDGTFTSYIPEHKCEEALSKSLESKVPFWKKIIMD